MNIDECPACHADRKNLQPYGAVVQEKQWHVCTVCSRSVLLTMQGDVVRVGKP